MADNQLQMPSYGGLTRFKEEYNSKFKFSPKAVVVAMVVVIVAIISLNLLFPIA
jgi:preprotein translocase subunit Sec61beta